MPTYCFKHPRTHRIFEISMSMRELSELKTDPDTGIVTLPDGRKAYRDHHTELVGYHHTPGTWPMLSDAAGVAPHQIEEVTKESVRAGIPTNFTEDGRAIFTSREHRKRYCEHIGLYDRNGGYSDPQRKAVV